MHSYIVIYYANLNHAFLEPQKYDQVIRARYEASMDGHAKNPEAKNVFETSGITIELIADKCPEVLAKRKAALDSGQRKFVGAPYAHPIPADIPEEDGHLFVRIFPGGLRKASRNADRQLMEPTAPRCRQSSRPTCLQIRPHTGCISTTSRLPTCQI